MNTSSCLVSFRRRLRAAWTFTLPLLALTLALPLHAQSATGTIEGRVQNAVTGNFLNNARVRVTGTKLEAFTDAAGEFRLGNVPAGPATLDVFYTGMAAQKISVTVAPGVVVQQDVSLRDVAAGAAGEGT